MEATPSNGKSSGNGDARAGQLHSQAGINETREAREKLMNDMKSVIGNAESWLKTSAAQSVPDLHAMQDQFKETLRTAKTDLLHMEASMLAKTRLAALATDTFVKDNPWKSVGLSAAVGVIFGLLVTRR